MDSDILVHDTYCRIVIRHASFDAARMLAARWKREISLEYLTEEKFVPLSTTDEYFQMPDYGETYLFSAQGQTILLDSRSLAAALARLPEQTQEGKNEVFYDCTLCKQILLLLYTKLLLSGIHADRSIHFLYCKSIEICITD